MRILAQSNRLRDDAQRKLRDACNAYVYERKHGPDDLLTNIASKVLYVATRIATLIAHANLSLRDNIAEHANFSFIEF